MKKQDRTIRDVKEGDFVIDENGKQRKVFAVGEVFILPSIPEEFIEADQGWTRESIMLRGWKLKQPEKQEIEIAEELFENDIDIVENRRLIIELQEVVNKLLKE